MLDLFSEIRPEERRESTMAFLTLFGVLAGHALLETARDALFLAKIPAFRLAWVYLTIAVCSLLIFVFQQQRPRKRADRSSLFLWLMISAALTLGFWVALERTGVWLRYALYVWSGVFATIMVVRFWMFLSGRFTIGQAKRVFALVGLGSILGALVGTGLAGMLAHWLPARHMLVAAAALFVVTALGPLSFMPRGETGGGELAAGLRPTSSYLLRSMTLAWKHSYLKRVAGLVLISTIALTLVDFLFKRAVAENVGVDRLGSFLAGTYFGLNLFSLLVQVVLVSWLVRSLAIDRVLSLVPALLSLATLGVVMGGGLPAALALKACDGGFRNSLHRTAMEVLHVPLTAELRARTKGIIDVLGQRGGQAMASLLILGAAVVSSPEPLLGAIILGLGLLWIGSAVGLRNHYLDLFRENLSEVSLTTRFDFPELDLASLETLIASLNSPHDAEVVATLDLLAEQGRVHLIPALVLYHPSERVVTRALDLFALAGRQDFVPITERLLEGGSPETRAATLRALAWVAPSSDLYRRFIDDDSAVVRTTALVGLVSYAADAAAEATINSLAARGTQEERLALARAIRYSPGAVYEQPLLQLAQGTDPRVLEAVAEAMAEVRSPSFIPSLLEMLPDRNFRHRARAALVSLGEEGLRRLEAALADPYVNNKIRRQIPRVITEFPTSEAGRILMRQLHQQREGSVRYRILRALLRLREQNPFLPLDQSALERELERNLKNYFRSLNWKLLLKRAGRENRSRATPVQEMIVDLLHHKETLTVERLFQLISLLYPGEDVRTIYRGIRSPDRKLRASSLELLENLLQPPLRDALVAAVDDLPEARKLEHAGPYFRPFRASYESVLKQLLERPGVGLRCLVAYHVGELKLRGLRRTLESLPSDLGGLVSGAVDRALAMLDQPAEPQVVDGS